MCFHPCECDFNFGSRHQFKDLLPLTVNPGRHAILLIGFILAISSLTFIINACHDNDVWYFLDPVYVAWSPSGEIIADLRLTKINQGHLVRDQTCMYSSSRGKEFHLHFVVPNLKALRRNLVPCNPPPIASQFLIVWQLKETGGKVTRRHWCIYNI